MYANKFLLLWDISIKLDKITKGNPHYICGLVSYYPTIPIGRYKMFEM